jgi:glycosyltransferase involved in cell wall biosynthesis
MDADTTARMISIVLPTYNGARYIEQAIESCLSQTYRYLELIVVDDGSRDDTTVKVEAYLGRDRRVRLVRHDRNRTLPVALNTGFAAAGGDYLTWTSDDNIYHPEALAKMLAFLEARADVGMVYTDYSFIDQDGRVIERKIAGEPHRLLSEDYNCLSPCFLYRRKVRDVVGDYANDLYLAEDFYAYRAHPSSLSMRYRHRIEPVLERALARHLRVALVSPSLKAALFFMLAQRTRARGELLPMTGYLAQSVAYSPRIFAQYLVRAAQKRVGRHEYAP